MIFVSTMFPPTSVRWQRNFSQCPSMCVCLSSMEGWQSGLTLPWGLWRDGFFHPDLQGAVGPQYSQAASGGWDTLNAGHCMAYPNDSSAGDWKWGVILLNHLVCVLSNYSELHDLKMRLFAAPGQFSVRGSCKNAKDPLVPLLGPWSPWVAAWCFSYLP